MSTFQQQSNVDLSELIDEGARDVSAQNEEERCEACGFGKYITKTKCCNKKICETCIRIYEFDYFECDECRETEHELVGTTMLWFRKDIVIYCAKHSDDKIERCEKCGSVYCVEHNLLGDDQICNHCKNGDIVLLEPPIF